MGGADWTGGWTAVAVAVQCAGGSQLAGGLCRDAAYAGSDVTSMQQENSKLAFRKIFSVPIMTPLQSAASSPAMIQRPGGLMVCRLRLAGG